MINPRAIATLGLGFGVRATTVLGLLDLAPVRPPADESGGGGRWLREAAKPRRPNDDEALLIALLL